MNAIAVDPEVIPRLPAPDVTPLQLLLLDNGIDAYVTGWTGWSHLAGAQSTAGAYVMPYLTDPESRETAIEVLLGAGYTLEEGAASITVHLEPADW